MKWHRGKIHEEHLEYFTRLIRALGKGSGLQYPGSSPQELILFVFQLVAQRLLFLLQLCEALLQLESQRGVDASGDILVMKGKSSYLLLASDCRASCSLKSSD